MAQTKIEKYVLYNGEIELLYYPNSHAYKVDGDKKIGVTTVMDVISKPGLMYYYMNEALNNITQALVPDNNGVLVLPTDIDTWYEMVKQAKIAHQDKSNRGKENGTRIHEWLEQFLIAKRDDTATPNLPQRLELIKDPHSYEDTLTAEIHNEFNNLVSALEEFIGWYESHTIEVVAIEQIVYSKQYDYAGRLDNILRIDGDLCLPDFKTNNPTWEYPKGIFPEMFGQLGGYDVPYTEEFYPELHKQNKSCFNKHVIFNFNKKVGRCFREVSEDVGINRSWFLHTLGVKRAQQHTIRKLSKKYKENQ